MRRCILVSLLGVLLLLSAEVDAGRIYRNFGQVKTISSSEKFYADDVWEESEELAWTTLTHLGARGWERRLMMTTLYNESRGRWDRVGDGGCAFGGFQVHVGAVVRRRTPKRWMERLSRGKYRCVIDNRYYLPSKYKALHPTMFMEPAMNTTVALATMRAKGSQNVPFHALARYAGLKPTNKKAKHIWGRHKHWWVTGLGKRIRRREKEERWEENGVVAYVVPIVGTLILK